MAARARRFFAAAVLMSAMVFVLIAAAALQLTVSRGEAMTRVGEVSRYESAARFVPLRMQIPDGSADVEISGDVKRK
jgi:hypothetical protein